MSYNVQNVVTDCCEHIDAAIFTGEALLICDLEELKNYIGRWSRAIAEHEKIEEEEDCSDIFC